MTYWRLALVVSFSTFALASLAFSAALSMAYPSLARAVAHLAPSARAWLLLRLRLAPAAAAMVFAFGVVLPTFLVFEPRETREAVSITLASVATIGAVLLLWSVGRGFRAWNATRMLERRWSAGAVPWGADSRLPVRLIDHEFPTVAVVGVTSPRLYVSRRVLAECSPAEVRAMFAHEAAHVISRDNLKRLLMRLCPDVIWVRTAIERAWACAAEEVADTGAARASGIDRLDLAQALVRVARLVPSAALTEPVSAFYLGGSIDARVRRLLDPTDEPPRRAWWSWAAGFACLSLLAAFIPAAASIQQLMEAVVRALP
jgi:Zn-dependent protease with chaperone function